MFKYNSCVCKTCGYYLYYPRIYFDDYGYLVYAHKEHLKIKMKTGHHTPVEKIIEFFVSMIAGCPDIKTVNNRLVPDKLAATA